MDGVDAVGVEVVVDSEPAAFALFAGAIGVSAVSAVSDGLTGRSGSRRLVVSEVVTDLWLMGSAGLATIGRGGRGCRP